MLGSRFSFKAYAKNIKLNSYVRKIFVKAYERIFVGSLRKLTFTYTKDHTLTKKLIQMRN